MIFAAVTDDGEPLAPEVAARLMTVPASASPLPAGAGPRLTEQALEAERSRKRRSLFDAQDEADRQRERLIAETEAKLAQALSIQALFSIRWSIQ